MKLKKWLKEYHNITYAQYKELPEEERWKLQAKHRSFCVKEQGQCKVNWRPMTEEEHKETEIMFEKEMERYEKNLKIQGIDERGNYTALHRR